jgi:hypothetical protein
LALFPAFFYGVADLTSSKTLATSLSKLIPAGIKISDLAVGLEVFLTAWDLNNRTPRFFSKFAA